MKRRSLLLLPLSFGLPALAGGPQQLPLTDRLAALQKRSLLPGFAVAVVSNKKVLYQRGFGLADVAGRRAYTEETVQNVGSVSKTVVGVALVKAIELGYFGLDTEIERILPFKVRNPHLPGAITVRQLVTHTSSIVDDEDIYGHAYTIMPDADRKGPLYKAFERDSTVPGRRDASLGAFLKNYLSPGGARYRKSNFAKAAPGSTYHYSNIGSALAAWLVELKSGMGFDAFTRRHIFEPLGMHATRWHADPALAQRQASVYDHKGRAYPRYGLVTYPDGGLTTSVSDLGRFLMAMVDGFHGGAGILSRAGFALLFKPQFPPDALPAGSPPGEPNSGVFWRIRKNGQVGHTGSDPGITAFMFIDPAKGTGRILMTNTEFGDAEGNDDPRVVQQVREIWSALAEVRS
ncbi:serine hydrolase domain-containing protein [Massilia sp. BKSP1R2A-1]|jgi:CubicO group peptidase (beta-lactamase class C family)|uniref:serine hydrolase domain-containing protein n=1 Tax=Massilia sp. BKSP1R2A-1 TaxID=3422595 RepID=UPI003D3398DD